jgi:HSP20 family molecular chaperone IbpA
MRFFRSVIPVRWTHSLRPYGRTPFARLIEREFRDPFFAPLINEIGPWQPYNFLVQSFSGPRVKKYEDAKEYRLEIEVPGFRMDELAMEITPSRILRVSGNKYFKGPAGQPTGRLSAAECADALESQEPESTPETTESTTAPKSEVEQGAETGGTEREKVSFRNEWSLPVDVDQEAVKAKLDHGILSVTLPKKADSESTTKIAIE